jgi:hypothetical protein
MKALPLNHILELIITLEQFLRLTTQFRTLEYDWKAVCKLFQIHYCFLFLAYKTSQSSWITNRAMYDSLLKIYYFTYHWLNQMVEKLNSFRDVPQLNEPIPSPITTSGFQA